MEKNEVLYRHAEKRALELLAQKCDELEIVERLRTYVTRKQAVQILQAAKSLQ